MIPYQELCDALAKFRARSGMPAATSAARRTSQPPGPPPASPPFAAPASFQGSQPLGPPPAFVPATTAEEIPPQLFESSVPEGDDRTDLHQAAPPRQSGEMAAPNQPMPDDVTGELDIDSVDVVEEENI